MQTEPPTETAEDRTAEPVGLGVLRAELDRIDDAIHDLLVERSHVVSRVGTEGRKAFTPYRPGREAAILRRLLARHTGPLHPQGVVRVWRELLAAGTAMQGCHSIAVCDPDVACGYTQLAREHFGALVPLRVHRSPAQALDEATSGRVGVAVLPMPAEADAPQEAWWAMLLDDRWRNRLDHGPRLQVVARLPFWSPRPEGAPRVQALALSRAEPDPSGEDRSLLGFEMDPDVDCACIAHTLRAAGLSPQGLLLRSRENGPETLALIEVDGFVTPSDPRFGVLDATIGRPVVLGAYATPVSGTSP